MAAKRSTNIQKDLKKAVALHREGRIEAAKDLYVRILAADPDHAEALHLLGVVAYQLGACDAAVDLIGRAIEQDGRCAPFHNNMGNALLKAGQAGRAIESYRRAVALAPDYAEAFFGLGNAYLQDGLVAAAVESYGKAIALAPGMAEAHNNLGMALQAYGDAEGAVAAFQKAVEIRPDYRDGLDNLGGALMGLERHEEAVEVYGQAVRKYSEDAELQARTGAALHAAGRHAGALDAFKKTVALRPDFGAVYNDMGTLLREMNRVPEAIACFERAISLCPNDPAAHNNLGIVFKAQERFDAAVAQYQQALKLKPDFAEAAYNLGNAYGRMGEIQKAVGCYRRAIQLRPDDLNAHCMLVRQLQHGCFWEDAAAAIARLKALTDQHLEEGRDGGMMPFLAFSISGEPEYNHRIAKAWSARISRKITPLPPVQSLPHDETDKITIGYLSSDFRNHATAHLMRSLFASHDRNRFRIYGYSYGVDDGSPYRRRIADQCDRFVELRHLSNEDAAHAIREDRVDILLDLKGHTEGNRLEICAHHPAPVQAAYLGFPGTCGADFIDYIITDTIVSPPEHSSFFTEKQVFMPHTYQVNDREQEIDGHPVARGAFGLPETRTVFCSFNEAYKIEPVVFNAWMEILRQVPDSVLWLLDKSSITVENLRAAAKQNGVSPHRLVFAGKLPKPLHLARIRLADLCLDTRTVSGHTTTSDALWAGVPVLSFVGTHFASSVSASLLRAMDMTEMIAESPEAYVKTAVDLASDAGALQQLRAHLAENRMTAPLFDTQRFARNLEQAFVRMWERFRSGKPPASFHVTDVDEI